MVLLNDMSETATSPRLPLHSRTTSSRGSTTPAARPPTLPGSVGTNMPPFLSPRTVTTPHNPAPSVQAPSPNYFAAQAGDKGAFLSDSGGRAKQNWSPPSSTVRSTAAASPSVLPLDQNPEFDAFRRQSEGKAFNLGGLGTNFSMNPPSSQPKHGRTASRTDASKEALRRTQGQSQSLDPSSAELGRSPKRVLSPGSMILPEEVRRASPASMVRSEREQKIGDNTLDDQPRFSLPLDTPHGPSGLLKAARADTLPEKNDMEQTLMATPQHVINLIESRDEQVLLLDLRVATQYATSHLAGALNLCIPTTLLKRPSFTVRKLAETFKDEEQRRKFESWKRSTYIIVYDNSSSQPKDAQICANMIKKFQLEGYDGSLYIVKGGFQDLARRFPSYVAGAVDGSASGPSKPGMNRDGPEVAAVAGGCPMPANDKPANPFFGNIRQNMDLIGGVGQIPLKHPGQATKSAENEFPDWLRLVSDDSDEGKRVSKKFEQIERREKKRMEEALSGKVSWGGSPKKQPTPGSHSVQIAGIEKGNKNRFNNIWPFEHCRVRLLGVPSHACDYFNGSYVKATRSNKRYISTQAPVPATFSDFWNVVWQQDVRVIVMLTAEREGAQVKAHNYWDKNQYGPFRLEFLSEKRASVEPSRIYRSKQRPAATNRASTTSQIPMAQLDSKDEKSSEQPFVIVRRFTLSHERYPFEPMREITQLQYSSWPDFGAPADPAHLLGVVEQTDAVVRHANKLHASGPQPPTKRPVLVHCSAGCGRTGTFCTVDSVIDMLKRQRSSRQQRQASPMDVDAPPKAPVDGFFSMTSPSGNGVDGSWVQREDLDLIEKTVEEFRHQRLSMVQSLRQYVLCYESIMEWLVEQHQPQSPASA